MTHTPRPKVVLIDPASIHSVSPKIRMFGVGCKLHVFRGSTETELRARIVLIRTDTKRGVILGLCWDNGLKGIFSPKPLHLNPKS